MITLYDFQAMSLNERAAAVWQGTFIGDRPEEEYFVQLYNLGTFYAEIFYDQQKNEVVKARGFKNTDLLQPYLKAIHIKF